MEFRLVHGVIQLDWGRLVVHTRTISHPLGKRADVTVSRSRFRSIFVPDESARPTKPGVCRCAPRLTTLSHGRSVEAVADIRRYPRSQDRSD